MTKSLCRLLIYVNLALVANFFTSLVCLLMLFVKIKFSQKYPNLQYPIEYASSDGYDKSAHVCHYRLIFLFLSQNICCEYSIEPPLDLKMPLTYVVNVYSDMSLSKGHIGSRGASKTNWKTPVSSFQ